jgi:hypothetical protein
MFNVNSKTWNCKLLNFDNCVADNNNNNNNNITWDKKQL